MKKLLFSLALTAFISGPFYVSKSEAAETTVNSAGLVINVPSGFMIIGNEEIGAIDFEPGTDNVVFKGKGGGQKPGKVVKRNPRGQQGGHMTITDDYQVAGLVGGNAVCFDEASNTLFIVEAAEDQVTIIKETTVTVN